MQLVRHDLKPLIQLSKLRSAHPGLLMQRGLVSWETNNKVEKTNLIECISRVTPPDFYELAFDRWFALTQSENFAHVGMKVDGRLFTGLALGGSLETGVMTHHTYGTPLIAGSSIKGAARAYAESIHLSSELIAILFGSDDERDNVQESGAGAFVWHDAWWVPRNKEMKPFVKEVITVHEQRYYSESIARAEGIDSPIPNLQIGIQGEFYFVFEGDPNWSRYVADLVAAMLEEQGVGAKTTSGYGYFISEKRLDSYIQKKKDEIKVQAIVEKGDGDELIRFKLSSLDNQALADALTKDKNKLYKELSLERESDEDMQLLAQIVVELQAELIHEWKKATGNKQKAYKFLQKYLDL